MSAVRARYDMLRRGVHRASSRGWRAASCATCCMQDYGIYAFQKPDAACVACAVAQASSCFTSASWPRTSIPIVDAAGQPLGRVVGRHQRGRRGSPAGLDIMPVHHPGDHHRRGRRHPARRVHEPRARGVPGGHACTGRLPSSGRRPTRSWRRTTSWSSTRPWACAAIVLALRYASLFCSVGAPSRRKRLHRRGDEALSRDLCARWRGACVPPRARWSATAKGPATNACAASGVRPAARPRCRRWPQTGSLRAWAARRQTQSPRQRGSLWGQGSPRETPKPPVARSLRRNAIPATASSSGAQQLNRLKQEGENPEPSDPFEPSVLGGSAEPPDPFEPKF